MISSGKSKTKRLHTTYPVISFKVDNVVGVLNKIVKIIEERNINILDVLAWSSGSEARIMMKIDSNLTDEILKDLRSLKYVYKVTTLPISEYLLCSNTALRAGSLIKALNSLAEYLGEVLARIFIQRIAISHGKSIHDLYLKNVDVNFQEKFKIFLELLASNGWFNDYLIKKFSWSSIEVLIMDPLEIRYGFKQSYYLRGLLAGFLEALFNYTYSVEEERLDKYRMFKLVAKDEV